MPKICLFDASGYLFRAYHALPPLTTSRGEPVNAIYGFSRMISKVLKSENPDYAVVCFDTPKPTFRHEEYKEYKAHRTEPEDDMIAQLPVAHELVEAWGLPSWKVEGFEADDLIATLATEAEKKKWEVLILSGDKDILQLVSPHVTVRDEIRKVDYNPAKVQDRYGVPPEKLVDLLCLMGDKVDNVEGVLGVGEKTAATLIQENGSLEGVFKELKGAKPAVKERLIQSRDRVLKNRNLIALRIDVPLPQKIEKFRIHPPDSQSFPALLKRLEFRGEFFGLQNGDPSPAIRPNKKRKVHTITTPEQLNSIQDTFSNATHLSYDFETDSLNPRHCQIVGVALSVKEGESWYIPVGHSYIGAPPQLTWDQIKPFLANLMQNPSIVKCAQNLKFDQAILEARGIQTQGPRFDTMIAAYCLDPERGSFGLKDLAADYLSEQMVRYEELTQKKKDVNLAQLPIDQVAPYAGADAEVTLRLTHLFQPQLKERKVQRLFDELEMPLVQVIQDMEKAGIAIDIDYLMKVGDRFREEMARFEKDIFDLAGEQFKLNSPKQLSRILFEKLKLPVIKRTKTGFSTNEDVLTKLKDKHPICEKILSFRELSKLTSTYVDALLELVDPQTKRIHTSFHQTGTSTGRLSSSDPNLQNIPIRTDHGREIRKAFVAAPGCVLVSADYSQIDLRALAHMSEDPVLVQTFQSGGDVHTATAAQVFHVEPSEVTTDMRRKAKAINFGIVYGQQAWGLSQGLGIDVNEAQQFIDEYFLRYAGIRQWIDQTLETARRDGSVVTLAGRKRRIPDILSENANLRGFAERIAINTPIQGSSADIIKAAMIELSQSLRVQKLKSQMLVQIHDELLFDVPQEETPTVLPLIRQSMEKAYSLKVPLVADVKMGPNWNQMEPAA